MKIPKTYKGIKVEVQKKTPKCKSRSIATADIKGGEPIIKIWPKNKRHVTQYVLKHEAAHIKLGHHKPPYPRTVGGYWRRELEAERLVNKNKKLPSSIIGDNMDNIIAEGPTSFRKTMVENPDREREYFMRFHKDFGLKINEVDRGLNYIKTHRKKKFKI